MTDDNDLHPLERMLLSFLDEHGNASDIDAVAGSDLPDEGSFRRASEWLLSRDLITEVSRSEKTLVGLGPLGEAGIAAGTTPELALAAAVSTGTTDLASVQQDETFDRARWGSAMGALTRAGILEKTGDGSLRQGVEARTA